MMYKENYELFLSKLHKIILYWIEIFLNFYNKNKTDYLCNQTSVAYLL